MKLPTSFPLACAFVLLHLAGLASCGSDRAARPALDPELEVRRADMAGLTRCYLVDRIYVCSQPDAEALELAERRGVEVVIDLRDVIPDDPEEFDIARSVRDLGLRYEWIPFQSGLIEDEVVDRAMDLLTAEGRGQVLVFSETGARGAMLLAIYRTSVMNVSISRALEDARRCGMKPGASEDQVRRQIVRRMSWSGGFQSS